MVSIQLNRHLLLQINVLLSLKSRPKIILRHYIPVSPPTATAQRHSQLNVTFQYFNISIVFEAIHTTQKIEFTYKAEEQLIQEALHAYNTKSRVKKRVNITKLAREHGVSYSHLRYRIAG